jgi:hypothetical protein
MEIGFIIGIVLFFMGLGILNEKGVTSRDNNIRLLGFVISYIGIWFFMIFGALSLFKREIISIRLNLLTGAIIGAVSGGVAGLMNLVFWMAADYFPPEDNLASVGLGCFGGFLSVLLGIIIGALIGKFWG